MALLPKLTHLRLPPLPTVSDIVRIYKLRAVKQLSQNFLMDEKVTNRIVRAAGNLDGSHVCEVGPGPGGITRSIIRQNPAQFVVVEKDRRFMPSLEMLSEATQGHIDFKVLCGDILHTDLQKIFTNVPTEPWDGPPPKVHLIGNLPFNVSTILLIRWLDMISQQTGAWAYGRTRMTLTFQKEVAERMAAPILTKERCRLSIMCQNWCRVNYKFEISGKAFVPRPDVDVGVVTLTPLKRPTITLRFGLIEKVVRQIFHLRQKYSIRGAESLFPKECRQELALEMYKLADLNPQTRPFQITLQEFNRLCHAYQHIITLHPEVADYDLRAPKNPIVDQNIQNLTTKIDGYPMKP